MVQRPEAGSIPETPGSYQFKDEHGRIIYVGKAKNLRSRLNSYFGDTRLMHPKVAQMVDLADSVEWMQVRNDVEALMLEYSLIQLHKPRFNIKYRDDKSYPYLALTVDQEWPRPMVTRSKRRKGVHYFGPYGHAHAIRETLDLLQNTFPLRTCSDNKLRSHERLGKPCLLFHIDKCSGPCVGEISKADYDGLVRGLTKFLQGDTAELVSEVEVEMRSAAERQEFELAARHRDRLEAITKAVAKQQMVDASDQNFDVVGIYGDDLETAVQVFYVRKGRVMGRSGFILDRVEALDDSELISRILEKLYYDENPIGTPKLVLLPELPDDVDLYTRWLSERRETQVELRVPKRGDKLDLAETVTKNAKESLQRHRLKRASDHNARARAMQELQDALFLPQAPLRIECYDMSHIQGTDYVGSMVVVEDGLPAKREYRRFKIKSGQGNDDFAAMEEVLTRRFTAYVEDKAKPVAERGKFRYPPQLLLVDGGKGQLSVAVRVLDELGLSDEIPVASLAKQFEEIFVPGRSEAIRIPRQSEALYLLQRIRDESHRFAITYHRQLRDKRMTKSVIDDVKGLGDARKKRLLKELGGITKVKRAALEQFTELTWLPDEVGQAVYDKIHMPQKPR